MNADQEAPKLPTLTITWDPATQNAMLTFSVDEFKTWDMIMAVLEMVHRQAETSLKHQQAQAMIMAQQQAAQDQAMRRRIIGH